MHIDGINNSDTTRKPNKDFNIHVNGTLNTNNSHTHKLWYRGGGEKFYFNLTHQWDGSAPTNDAEIRNMKGVNDAGTHNHSIDTTIYSSAISNWDSETAPKNIKFLYCIKY